MEAPEEGAADIAEAAAAATAGVGEVAAVLCASNANAELDVGCRLSVVAVAVVVGTAAVGVFACESAACLLLSCRSRRWKEGGDGPAYSTSCGAGPSAPSRSGGAPSIALIPKGEAAEAAESSSSGGRRRLHTDQRAPITARVRGRRAESFSARKGDHSFTK